MQERLTHHASVICHQHMRDLFAHDFKRAKNFSIELPGLYVDYSKNIINAETLDLLLEYARQLNIKASIDKMHKGEKINVTEHQPALHTALRAPRKTELYVDDINIIKPIHDELDKMQAFAFAVHSGKHKGWTNKRLDTFVNIGIGGSDIGAKMVINALEYYRINKTRSFFISNIDYEQIRRLKQSINPETSLFIISSKSFSTIETKINAETIKNWVLECGCHDLARHFVAVTANDKKAIEFGIAKDNIFKLWGWVGGRFSLWSTVGLPIVLAIGDDNFRRLLQGAHELDQHFLNAPMKKNIPIMLALLDVWYSHFLDARTHAFVPYDQSLQFFPDYLAQLMMESNGKSINLSGNSINQNTSPIIWGDIGTNAQHAFFQLLHQGTQLVPVDFLLPLHHREDKEHHAVLFSNCIAQASALMQGAHSVDKYKHCPGNRPSTTILYDEMKPETLGKITALYEHRAFVQGLIWQINSFDQPGVELGKKMALSIHQQLSNDEYDERLDASSKILLEKFRDRQKA